MRLLTPRVPVALQGRAATPAPTPTAGLTSDTAVTNAAHRGASHYAPENTLGAIREGIAMGSDLVELDVQRSKDGELVLIHDTHLARTTDAARVFPHRAPWRVSAFTYDEMLRLDAGSWKGAEYVGERIPTLAEAIATIRSHDAGLLLEVKAPWLYPGIEFDIAWTMRSIRGYLSSAVSAERLVVQSFDFGSMRTYRALEPNVTVGLLGTPRRRHLRELGTWADQVNPHHLSSDARYVAAVHAAGMDCQVWTVNGVRDMNRAIDRAVDGVITNRPDVLEQVLRDRSRLAA